MSTIPITHIITGLGTGGAERALYNFVTGPSRDYFSHQVVSLLDCGTYGPMLRDAGIEVHTLNLKRWPRFGRLLGRATSKAKILQGWMYHGNLAAYWISQVHGTQLAWNIRHSLDDLGAESRSTRWAIRANARRSHRVDKVIFNSRSACDQHIEFGFSDRNTLVIPNGFDADVWAPNSEARLRLRSELNISQKNVVICHVGRYHPSKDHASLLTAAIPVLREHPDTELVLVGPRVTFDTAFFRENIPEELAARVHLLGDRRDVQNILAASDVFVQSSITEGFPNSLGEAMATGLAVVATAVGDSTYILSDAGILVPPRSPNQLADALRQFLHDGNRRIELGQKARHRIQNTFQKAVTDRLYVELYESMLQQNPLQR